MVFTTSTLFKGIPCPEGDRCKLTHCIYSHEPARTTVKRPNFEVTAPIDPDARSKRRKLETNGAESSSEHSTHTLRDSASPKESPDPAQTKESFRKQTSAHSYASLKPRISRQPPPSSGALSTSSAKLTPKKTQPVQARPTVSLNPKLIANAPKGHEKRSRFLQLIHAEYVRLNKLVKENVGKPLETGAVSKITDDDVYHADELITMSVEEEAEYAETHGAVYQNKMASRIQALKKMKHSELIIKRREATQSDPKNGRVKTFKSTLNTEQELAMLDVCIFSKSAKDRLKQHGFIFDVPPEPVDNASTEPEKLTCDRCRNKFHLLSEPDIDGRYTDTKCCYHPARYDYRLKKFPCCDNSNETLFCTVAPNHVYKYDDPSLMSKATPFIDTPSNASPSLGPNKEPIPAIAFDCEMGWTTTGFELLRLTAVIFPSGSPLIDVLVLPKGEVLDYNTAFSGISATDYSPSPTLPILPSTESARSLLCSFITPSTPLIGHGIENDLKAVRLCHPTVIDTAILYSHPKGLPLRRRLRDLSREYLKKSIQTAGAAGHDSAEDARAAGELVRVRVADLWNKMKAEGWKMEAGSGDLAGTMVLKPPEWIKKGTGEGKPRVTIEEWREFVVYGAFVPGR